MKLEVCSSLLRQSSKACATLCVALSAGAAIAQITVDTPASNSPFVNSPFYLQAEAASCSGYPTASMAWSYDGYADNVFSGAQSIQTMATIANDTTPSLHIKAWNTQGALCESNLQLNIGGSVNVASPAQGGVVSSPFTLQASAPTCGGQTTTGMAYNLDSTSGTTYSGAQSMNTSVTASTGWHILRTKAWGNGGAYCETDVHINVSAGLVPPANAGKFTNLESSSTPWQTQADAGSPGYGSNAGSTTAPDTTYVYAGDSYSRLFDLSKVAVQYGAMRWFVPLDENQPSVTDPATHFQYDLEVYIPDNSKLANVEMDVNHSISSPTKQVYILAVQCAYDHGFWEVTTPAGWVQTTLPCTRNTLTSGTWHHVQIQTHHDANGGSNLYYDAIALDGNANPVTTCKKDGATTTCVGQANVFTHPWATLIGPNFQLDGEIANNPAQAYTDNFTIYYW